VRVAVPGALQGAREQFLARGPHAVFVARAAGEIGCRRQPQRKIELVEQPAQHRDHVLAFGAQAIQYFQRPRRITAERGVGESEYVVHRVVVAQ